MVAPSAGAAGEQPEGAPMSPNTISPLLAARRPGAPRLAIGLALMAGAATALSGGAAPASASSAVRAPAAANPASGSALLPFLRKPGSRQAGHLLWAKANLEPC